MQRISICIRRGNSTKINYKNIQLKFSFKTFSRLSSTIMSSAVVDKFKDFVDLKQETAYLYEVDLCDLIAEFNTYTPLKLKMSDPESSLRNMPTAVILNLCKNVQNKRYPTLGLLAIKDIVTKELTVDNTKMQLIILVHVMKMDIPATSSAWYCLQTERKMCKSNDSVNLSQAAIHLLSTATTTVNDEVYDLIDESIVEVFGGQYSERISATKAIPVDVTFVCTNFINLRGFSGYDCVYINESYFDQKRRNKPGSTDAIVMLDIITVTIHEFAHVRIRQVLDDLNMSTPIEMITGPAPADDCEFGRILEMKGFGLAVDWYTTTYVRGVPLAYTEALLNAIENNETLPSVPPNAILYERPGLVKFNSGIDVCGADDLCIE